jgi:hypothetical protein
MKNQISTHSNILKSTSSIILVALIMVSYATSTVCWPQIDKLEFETSEIAQNCHNLNHHPESHTTFNCDLSFELVFKLTNHSKKTNTTSIYTVATRDHKTNVFKTLNIAPFGFYIKNNRPDLSLYSQKTALLYYD